MFYLKEEKTAYEFQFQFLVYLKYSSNALLYYLINLFNKSQLSETINNEDNL